MLSLSFSSLSHSLRSLLRLRQELTKLIARHTESISDDVAKATKQSAMYEVLLQGPNVGHFSGVFKLSSEGLFLFRKGHI